MEDRLNFKGKTFLIVEDDDTNFLYLSQLLKLNNATVIRSTNGLDAFFDCMTLPVDIVLMDIRLPKLNGNETIRLIKKYQPHLPIISVTASVMNEDRIKSLDAGADAFLTKPVLPKEILPVLNYFVNNTNYKHQLFAALS